MAVALIGHVMMMMINSAFFPILKADITQEKDQKSLFDLYSGLKEIDFLEKLESGLLF